MADKIAFQSKEERDVKRARREGYASAGRPVDNPYDPDSLLATAWDEGRENAEDEASDSFACSMDPSMRDTHGEDC